jgi:PST family polysaccharide transporter
MFNTGINEKIFFLYFLIVPGNILLSYWFYLGMEDMKFANYPNIISRLGYAVSIFLFLKNEEQFYLVPLFYGGFLVLGGSASLLLISYRYKLKLKLPNLRIVVNYFTEGWSIFISTFAINLYRRSNIFILGLVAPSQVVGYYSAGEKIIVAIQSIFNPIIQAFYPFISRRTDKSKELGIKDIIRLIKAVSLISLFISLILIIFSPSITTLVLGLDFMRTVEVLRLGAFVVLFGNLNFIIGIIYMTNFGYKRQFANRVIITGIINIIFCLIFSYYYQEIGAALSFLTAEVTLFIMLVLFAVRSRRNWRSVLND